MKIDPDNFPVIIIAAFVFGMILAMALGFRPKYGSMDEDRHGYSSPGMVQIVESLETTNL